MVEKKVNVKKRNWAFVLYPESAPADWREQLQMTGLQCAVSPLHDKDLNADNTLKKAHYHIILNYSGPTSFNVVKGLTEQLNQPIPQSLEQIRGYYRYLTHKDNPEKYQYDENEVTTINGFDISEFIEMTKSEVLEIKLRLQRLVRETNIVEYADLLDYIQDNGKKSEYDVASSNTIFFNTYIKSRRYSVGGKPKVDIETGEVIEM